MTNTNIIDLQKSLEIFVIDRKIAQILPFCPSNRREVNTKKTYTSNWGSVVVISRETLNSFDFKVFSAFSYYVVKNKQRVQNAGEITFTKKNNEIIKKELVSIIIEKNDFTENYMHLAHGGKQEQIIDDSFKRFSDCTWYFTDKHKTEVPYKIIQEVGQTDENHWIIIFSKIYFENVIQQQKNTLYLQNKFIQKTSTNVATLLVAFLMTQKQNTSFSLRILAEICRINTHVTNKQIFLLDKAFNNLVYIGYLNHWYKEKRKEDTYYTFDRVVLSKETEFEF